MFEKEQPADEFGDDRGDVLVVDGDRGDDDGHGADGADGDRGDDGRGVDDDREHLVENHRFHQLQHRRQVQEILFVRLPRKMEM